MAEIPNFKDLTRFHEEIFSKGYCFGALALVTLSSTVNSQQFKARFSRRKLSTSASTVLSSASLQSSVDNATFRLKRCNDSNILLSVDYRPQELLENLGTKLDLLIQPNKLALSPTGTISYYNKNFNGSLQVTDNPLLLTSSLTVGQPDKGVGAKLKFSLPDSRFVIYNFAAWWYSDQSKFVFRHISTNSERYGFGQLVGSYYQELRANTKIGGEILYDVPSKSVSLEIGAAYQYDNDTEVKGKLASAGSLGLGLVHNLAESIRVNMSTELNVMQAGRPGNDFRIGLRIDLGQNQQFQILSQAQHRFSTKFIRQNKNMVNTTIQELTEFAEKVEVLPSYCYLQMTIIVLMICLLFVIKHQRNDFGVQSSTVISNYNLPLSQLDPNRLGMNGSTDKVSNNSTDLSNKENQPFCPHDFNQTYYTISRPRLRKVRRQ